MNAPHFAFPFNVSNGVVAQVEQDSLEEIEQCVEAVLRTEVGSRLLDAPEFGRPDETFQQLGPGTNADAYIAAIERFEPRARQLGEAQIDGVIKRVLITAGETA